MVNLMNSVEIIEKYNATDVVITDDFVEWIRSDHAGEMGAVWIYKGLVLRSGLKRFVVWRLSMVRQKSSI